MKRVKVREDLVSKMEFFKRYNINRVRIDKMVETGELKVERISGRDFIILTKDLILKGQK
jgi:hypothetical protein